MTGNGIDLSGAGVHDQPVLGRFVGVPQVDVVLVQPCDHVGLAGELEVQPVVAESAGVILAVVVACLVATRIPEESNESAPLR